MVSGRGYEPLQSSGKPYGISMGEWEGKGSQKKWSHGRYRKAAEAAEAKSRLDANQTVESNIRERQADMKSARAYTDREKRRSRKRTSRRR
jgi:hypothetical protein